MLKYGSIFGYTSPAGTDPAGAIIPVKNESVTYYICEREVKQL